MLGEIHAAGKLSRCHPKRLLQRVGRTGAWYGLRRLGGAPGPAPGLDLPVAAAEHGNALAVGRDAVDLELGRADHEVDVGGRLRSRGRGPRLRRGTGSRCRGRCGSRRSRRAACRRTPCRAARSGPGDRRARARRAEARRRRSRAARAARSTFASASISTATPPSKRTRNPRNDRPVAQDERLRRGDVTFGAERVGRREDLLGRQIREVPKPVDRREVRRPPGMRRQQADRQLRARARAARSRRTGASARRFAESFRTSMRSSHAWLGPARRDAARARARATAARMPRPPADRGRRAWPTRDAGTGRCTSWSRDRPRSC